jgi:hypothetical protein
MWLEFPFDPAYLKALRVGQGQSERVTPEVTEQVTEQVARLLVALGGQTLSLQELMQSAGIHSPSELKLHHIERRISEFETHPLSELMPSVAAGSLLQDLQTAPEVFQRYWPRSGAHSFQLSA